MKKKSSQKIVVDGIEITMFQNNKEEYISLTDIAKQDSDEPRFTIRNWMSTRNTITYLGTWENLYNTDFNRAGYRTFKDDFFEKPSSLTPKKWIELTNAKGITSKAGRYGGTYAHRDIAINFCYWISPVFQVYLIREFQRLKEEEAQQLQQGWDVKRQLSKINYKIHTDAIKQKLIPRRISPNTKAGFIFANEADVLNVAVFGMTAKEWRLQYPEEKGNIRDTATVEQLLILSNLEAINAELIRVGVSQEERVIRLNEAAINQMQSLVSDTNLIKKLPEK